MKPSSFSVDKNFTDVLNAIKVFYTGKSKQNIFYPIKTTSCAVTQNFMLYMQFCNI